MSARFEPDAQAVEDLMLSGLCCTQVMVEMALDETGRSDPAMVAAVAPLCAGMGVGGACGALSGGLLALAILRREEPVGEATARRYVEWFAEEFGSTECRDLVADDPVARADRCPALTAAAYAKAHEMAAEE